MNLTIDLNQMVSEIFEEEQGLQVSVAEKILAHIDKHLMESGNDKVKIGNLLFLQSTIKKEIAKSLKRIS